MVCDVNISPQYEFSEEQNAALRKARRLAYLTIVYLAVQASLMYLVMGSSQAMKTAWIEDLLSFIPPACFLVGSHICWRKPSRNYPYGYHRAISVLYLCAALALFSMGAYLLVDSLLALFTRDHPSIGMQEFFGIDIWLGWWMVMVLLIGAIPAIFLGRAKIAPAFKLNDKILYTDGKMNKADWMTAVAAAVGVLGIGLGWWWADAVAAAIISLDIINDGFRQTRDAVTGLLNRAPTAVDDGFLDLPEQIQELLNEYEWVAEAKVRLYEQGHLFFGEAFFEPRDPTRLDAREMREAMTRIANLDWRLRGVSLSVVGEEQREENP